MRMSTHHVARIAALCVALVAHAASVDGGSTILRDGTSQRIDARELKEIGSEAWPGWLAVDTRTGDRAPESDARSVLALDDGQRITGIFESSGHKLNWRSRDLGLTEIDLERVQWIGPPALATEVPPTRDRVVLLNGDRVDGFVNAIEPDRGVQVETQDSAPQAVSRWIDLARTVSIQLAPRPRAASGWRLWLRDGSVVDVDGWQRKGDQVQLLKLHLPGAAPVTTIPWSSVLGVACPGSGMQPLWSQVWRTANATPVERLSAPVIHMQPQRALDLHDLDLHGPGSFIMQVPPGTTSMHLTLASPPLLQGQLACTVRVLDGDQEVCSQRLDASSKPRAIDIPVHGPSITFQLTDSAKGAFGAAVRLQQGWLLTTPAQAPTAPPPNAPGVPAAAGAPGPG